MPASFYFASRGTVTVAFQYRLNTYDGATVTQSTDDAISALRWLSKNASKLGIEMRFNTEANPKFMRSVLHQYAGKNQKVRLCPEATELSYGWGNTFHRRFPIVRIDHLYATRHLIPIRCRAVTTRNSDHRMVVADFLTGPEIKL